MGKNPSYIIIKSKSNLRLILEITINAHSFYSFGIILNRSVLTEKLN